MEQSERNIRSVGHNSRNSCRSGADKTFLNFAIPDRTATYLMAIELDLNFCEYFGSGGSSIIMDTIAL